MFDSCDVAAYIAQECVERKISYNKHEDSEASVLRVRSDACVERLACL